MNQKRSLLAAALVSAGLSLLFIVLYGATNWFTSIRSDVPSFYFEWERQIPFIPAMIVFYMTINVFFTLAPFLTKTEKELTVLALRMGTAIVVACICFLLFPLKFGFERPYAEGFAGMVFNKFRLLDPPFNECPSLHIALGMIIAETFLRNTRGLVRVFAGGWLLMVGLSPVPVYQHHVIDIIGGFILGLMCMHFIQEERLRQPFVPNVRVGGYYAAGAVVLAIVGWVARPWGILLWWPVLSLAIVAMGYWFLGPGIYRKQDGRLPWTTWVLLWPVLIGQRVSLAYYARKRQPFDRLTDRVIIGRRLRGREVQQLPPEVGAVLDVTCEFSEAVTLRERRYTQMPILDLTAPTPRQLDDAVAWLRNETVRGEVYVHCKIGFSRTAAVAGAYLIAAGLAESAEEAIKKLRQARGGMVIRKEVVACLEGYAKTLDGKKEAVVRTA